MRRLLLSLALTLTLSAVGASSALAQRPEGGQTAPLYGPNALHKQCNEGGIPTPQTFGFAVFNTPGNEATVSGEVVLKRAGPNATFGVELAQVELVGLGLCKVDGVGTITTSTKGNGNLHFTDEREPGTTLFNVIVTEQAPSPGGQVFASPSVELD